MTRYINLRKYAERDDEVACTWAPVSHYTPPELRTALRLLPEPLFMRARLLQQAMPVLGRLHRFDAVMIHLFEADILSALRGYFCSKPVRIVSTDEAPITNRDTHPLYPQELAKGVWRSNMRLALDRWRIRRTDYFIPFSHWVAGNLTECGAPKERVYPLHVGLDLDIWTSAPRLAGRSGDRVKILFVGADFDRKGGALLLEVFNSHFRDRAELHLVTKQAPESLPAHVHVYADFEPNDHRLVSLYSQADMLVVPTTADTGPLWVFMEAMAMRLPIIGTDTGANTELLRHGETGFVVKIGNGEALTTAIDSLVDDPGKRRAMGERGRALIETKYSARVNVPLIIRAMKDVVDASRRPLI
ncbi:MAG TPA: glycosyltransferase family 4 protein, partial [Burkholderiales bacterium]|nr:glycosyltransferase family 4 protein [Burkholderiales bacterium]